MKIFLKIRRLLLLLFMVSSDSSSPVVLAAWISEQYPVHTLLLCRHGDSIWNGGCPGQVERFTGWTDVPLSKTGEQEAIEAASQLNSYLHEIDACFTSILSRAQATTRTCLSSLVQKQKGRQQQRARANANIPPVHVDYRLNERHYGALQEFCKSEVEQGKFPQWQDRDLIQQWRRSWFVRPPPMDDNDPRRLAELARYSNLVDDSVPNGESLEMVAKNRIRPFVNEVLTPLLDARSIEKRKQFGKINGEWPQTTGLIVAHANSLRALLGVICEVEDDPGALTVLEKLRIPTGVPLVIHYSASPNAGKYQAWPVPFSDECIIQLDDNGQLAHPPSPPENMGHDKLPVWPLNMCIPLMYHAGEHEKMGSTTTTAAPVQKKVMERAPLRQRRR